MTFGSAQISPHIFLIHLLLFLCFSFFPLLFYFFFVQLPDLIHRAILISGSALSPWAIQRDPLAIKKKVATDTGCHGDLLDDDIAPCLRKKSISELLAIKLDPPR